ncbi:MAG: peptidylprolyl isomerase [Hyphomicrobiales bacterium]|nr:peptidylprolyl isomerase [Hyphomicrobiales bacterium]MCY4032425.1 peptidylprolyl isomerase [Hyphomicrobiales bacterium]MCY4038425.1 peptidylprolyl isomerase [Hyphomicrobiales bacterium]
MKNFASFTAFCIVLLIMSVPASAQSSQGIVAVVNNNVISDYDLEQRVGLALVTSGVQRTPEIEDALRPQALNRLIDEKLKMNEAARYNISIPEQEIQNALGRIAQDNNMSFEEIERVLSENNVTVESLRSQLVADIAWNRLLEGLFLPQVSISQDEINQAYERAVDERSQTQYLVSEIVLPFDSAASENIARENAYRLLQPLRTGSPFAPLAQQFSQSPTSANGGRIGWVVAGQLEDEIDRVLPLLKRGEISEPIRTGSAYYIIQLLGKNESGKPNPQLDIIRLGRAFFPLSPDAGGDVLAQADANVQRFYVDFSGCDNAPDLADSVGASFRLLDRVTLAHLPPQLREQVDNSGIDGLFPPSRTNEGVEVVALCEREPNQVASITPQEVERGMIEREIELLGRKHLQELRSNATIELR